MMKPFDHLSELLEIVRRADAAVMDIYDAHSAEVTLKPDNTPLTQADIMSHTILTKGFATLFPDIPIVSEEGDEQRNRALIQQDRFWLIDPIDGTKGFIAHDDNFTICAGLIEHNQPVFGIVSAPALGCTYYGGPGYGSFKKTGDAAPIQIHVSDSSTGFILGSSREMNQSTTDFIASHFPGLTLRGVGSQLKLPYIAEGSADAYPRIDGPLHLWDMAAGHAILAGAGGSVTRPDGSKLDYQQSSLLIGDFVANRA